MRPRPSVRGASPLRFRHLHPSELDDGVNYIVFRLRSTARRLPAFGTFALLSNLDDGANYIVINISLILGVGNTPRNQQHPVRTRNNKQSLASSHEPSSQVGIVAEATHKTIPFVGRERARAGVDGPFNASICIAISFVCGFVLFPFLFRAATSTNTFGSFCSSQGLHSKLSFHPEIESADSQIQYHHRVRSRQAGLFELVSQTTCAIRF